MSYCTLLLIKSAPVKLLLTTYCFGHLKAAKTHCQLITKSANRSLFIHQAILSLILNVSLLFMILEICFGLRQPVFFWGFFAHLYENSFLVELHMKVMRVVI